MYVTSRLYGRLVLSIRWCCEAQHLIIPKRVISLANAIAGVALNGINPAILDLFHNAGMVGKPVLSVFIIPVEKDNITGARLVRVVLP